MRPSRFGTLLTALLLAAAGGIVAVPQTASAASTPPSGTVGPDSGSRASWDFGTVGGAGSGGTPIEKVCAPGSCSAYALTVALPTKDTAKFYSNYVATLTFHCNWTSPGDAPDDIDCFAFSPENGEIGPGKPDTADGGANYEDITITDPEPGTWSLRADGAASPPTDVLGTATLTYAPVTPAAGQVATDPAFNNFDFDPAYQTRDAANRPDAGEPSMGVDWATGKVMYMAGDQVTQLTYGNSAAPPVAKDVTPADSHVNEDAILFTDRETNRTWALGLLLAGSYMAYTDDDGATWTPAAAISVPAEPDHETLGSGPYHTPVPASASYPSSGTKHIVYYCAQTIVEDAYCGHSDDGGKTFSEPAAPLWNGDCSPIHGHVRVGPTGDAFVPNGGCTDKDGKGRVGVAVSIDNGQSFFVSTVPDSSVATSDPSVMQGPDGTIYMGYQASDGHPMIATGHLDEASKTIAWTPSKDVGQFQDPQSEGGLVDGVQNTEFAEVITGDPGRAAFAFLGTGTPGNDQLGTFAGTWYIYVSYTFDGGGTWSTVNATPNEPVQRGCIWNGGLVNACRNLLDFNDIGVDRQGRVYVAYTDGCTTTSAYSCDTTPGIHGWTDEQSGDQTGCKPSEVGDVTSSSTCTFARLSAIVQQSCGRGLIAASDPGFDSSPTCATLGTAVPEARSAGSLLGVGIVAVVAALLGTTVLARRRRGTRVAA
jgi:hypothetical protein